LLAKSGQLTGFKKFKLFLEMVKFEHTIFALPFAYLGALWVAAPSPYGQAGLPTFYQLFWITIVMVGARTFAMTANRLIDREIDARNPRTADRALPKKLLSVPEVIISMIISFLVFIVAVYQLSPLAKLLWPIALVAFSYYSYLKRFFPLANLGLGFCLSLAPLGAWIAVTNTVSLPAVLLALAVFAWASGFDIIYSCQDYEVDKEQNLRSIAVCFGIRRALCTTKYLHALTIILLVAAGVVSNFGLIYFIGIGIASALLIYENTIVKADDLSRVDAAFFTLNSFFSVIVFVFALIEILRTRLA